MDVFRAEALFRTQALALSVAFALTVASTLGCATRPNAPCAAVVASPTPSASAETAGADPTVTDPEHYKVVMDNENVRVLRYHDAPRDKTHPHHHPASVLYALSAFQRRLTFPDGTAKERTFQAGDVMWLPPQTHTGENIGTTDTEVLLVEIKRPTGANRLLSATLPSAEPTPSSATAPADTSSMSRDVVSSLDRETADRALDAGRKPAELLSFLGLSPGMRVAEISAGTGYTTELLARVVGDGGKVYGQNNRFVLEKFAEKRWAERLAKPVNKNVVRVDRELDEPLPFEARELDAVVNVLFYHDSVWMKTDRTKMNANIFAALKHGGVYVIVDHSGRPGTGTSETKTLHRIEEKVVRDEAQRAGFRLAGESDFLRNPKDARDWSASPSTAGERRGESDRFALKFVKP